MSEFFEKNLEINNISEELNNLISGKEIELYEYDSEFDRYDFINNFNVESVKIIDDELTLCFGKSEWSTCLINETDLIKIIE